MPFRGTVSEFSTASGSTTNIKSEGSLFKSSIFSSPFGRHKKNKNYKNERNKAILNSNPCLNVKVNLSELILQKLLQKSTNISMLKFLASSASNFRVDWVSFNIDSDEKDLQACFGKFKDYSGKSNSIEVPEADIFKAKILVDSTVHESLHMLLTKTTTEFNSLFNLCFGESFIGGETLVCLNKHEKSDIIPLNTVKRLILDVSSKDNYSNLAEFVFLDSALISKDDSGNDIGIYALNSVDLPEVPINVKDKTLNRAILLEGSGIVIKKSVQCEQVTEICLILRTNMSWMKKKTIKKALLKFINILKGLKKVSVDAISLHGSYSWHKGYQTELKLVSTTLTQDVKRKMSKGVKNKAERLLGVELNESISEDEDNKIEKNEENEEETGRNSPIINESSKNINNIEIKVIEEDINKRYERSFEPELSCLSSKGASDDFNLPSREFSGFSGTKKLDDSNNLKRQSMAVGDSLLERKYSSNYKQKYEEIVEQKIRLEAEMRKLKEKSTNDSIETESQNPIGGIIETNSNLFLDEEEISKMKVELEKQKLENAQLRKKYEVIKAQTNNESLDKYNWNGELDSAESIFLKLAKEVQENPSDMVLLNDFERFEEIVRKHPEYKKRELDRIESWLKTNEPINNEALKEMKNIIPENIASLSKLQINNKYPKRTALARRVNKNRSAFSVYFMSSSDLQKFHIVDLKNKYEPKNFDLVELRAYFAVLPEMFKADGDGQKSAWKENIRKKLADMIKKESNGSLPKSKIRDSSYSFKVNKVVAEPPMRRAVTSTPAKSQKLESKLPFLQALQQKNQTKLTKGKLDAKVDFLSAIKLKADDRNKVQQSLKTPTNNLMEAIRLKAAKNKNDKIKSANQTKPAVKIDLLASIQAKAKERQLKLETENKSKQTASGNKHIIAEKAFKTAQRPGKKLDLLESIQAKAKERQMKLKSTRDTPTEQEARNNTENKLPVKFDLLASIQEKAKEIKLKNKQNTRDIKLDIERTTTNFEQKEQDNNISRNVPNMSLLEKIRAKKRAEIKDSKVQNEIVTNAQNLVNKTSRGGSTEIDSEALVEKMMQHLS